MKTAPFSTAAAASGRRKCAISGCLARDGDERHQDADYDDGADDHRAGRQIGNDRGEQARRIAERANRVRLEQTQVPGIERHERRHDKSGEDKEQTHELYGYGDRAAEEYVEPDAP